MPTAAAWRPFSLHPGTRLFSPLRETAPKSTFGHLPLLMGHSCPDLGIDFDVLERLANALGVYAAFSSITPRPTQPDRTEPIQGDLNANDLETPTS